MDFAAPMRDTTPSPSTYIGAVVLHLDARSVLFPLLQAWPPSVQTGESVLAVVRGDRVVSLNPLSVTGARPLSFSRPLTDTDLPAVMAARGRIGVVQGVDYRGEPVLAAVGKVPGTPWYLVAKQDVAVIDQAHPGPCARDARLGRRHHRPRRCRHPLLLAQPRDPRPARAGGGGAGAAPRGGTVRGAHAGGQGDRPPARPAEHHRRGERLRPGRRTGTRAASSSGRTSTASACRRQASRSPTGRASSRRPGGHLTFESVAPAQRRGRVPGRGRTQHVSDRGRGVLPRDRPRRRRAQGGGRGAARQRGALQDPVRERAERLRAARGHPRRGRRAGGLRHPRRQPRLRDADRAGRGRSWWGRGACDVIPGPRRDRPRRARTAGSR